MLDNPTSQSLESKFKMPFCIYWTRSRPAASLSSIDEALLRQAKHSVNILHCFLWQRHWNIDLVGQLSKRTSNLTMLAIKSTHACSGFNSAQQVHRAFIVVLAPFLTAFPQLSANHTTFIKQSRSFLVAFLRILPVTAPT